MSYNLHVDAIGDPQAIIARAERYLAHQFDILGSGWCELRHGMQAKGFEGHDYSDTTVKYELAISTLNDEHRAHCADLLEHAKQLRKDYVPIDWHIDFKSGYRSQLVHHASLTYGNVPGVDMKTTADLNRLYHLPVLALAWRATGEAKYLDEAYAQLLDWLGQNPFELGPAWRANMNVAIRAANLCVFEDLARESLARQPYLQAGLAKLIEASLKQHRLYISRYLEFPEGHYHPNHYIANLAGLLLVCVRLYDSDPDAPAWKALALREIRKELKHQVLPDGFDFESATSYHALVLEMLTYSLALVAGADGATGPREVRDWIASNVSSEALATLESMFMALRDILNPDGLMPQIGDSDSGRFLLLETPGDGRDWRFLACLGAAMFENPSLAQGCSKQHASAGGLVFGQQVPQIIPRDDSRRSVAFKEVGLYVMRLKDAHCLISAGPIGTDGSGGHSHCDKLAFTLWAAGREFLVDPGVYVYTASREMRDLFRSTAMHNTLRLGNEEQNRPNPKSPWWGCLEDTRCHCARWETTDGTTIFEGVHHGYERLDTPVTHRRTIILNALDRMMRVTDTLVAAEHASLPPARWTFVLHPSCVARVEPKRATITHASSVMTVEASHDGLALSEAWFAPHYGRRERTSALTLETNNPSRETTFIFRWANQ